MADGHYKETHRLCTPRKKTISPSGSADSWLKTVTLPYSEQGARFKPQASQVPYHTEQVPQVIAVWSVSHLLPSTSGGMFFNCVILENQHTANLYDYLVNNNKGLF